MPNLEILIDTSERKEQKPTFINLRMYRKAIKTKSKIKVEITQPNGKIIIESIDENGNYDMKISCNEIFLIGTDISLKDFKEKCKDYFFTKKRKYNPTRADQLPITHP